MKRLREKLENLDPDKLFPMINRIIYKHILRAKTDKGKQRLVRTVYQLTMLDQQIINGNFRKRTKSSKKVESPKEFSIKNIINLLRFW